MDLLYDKCSWSFVEMRKEFTVPVRESDLGKDRGKSLSENSRIKKLLLPVETGAILCIRSAHT